MLDRLKDFEQRVVAYLRQILEGNAKQEYILSRIEAYLDRLLPQVFEGVLLSSSSLRAGRGTPLDRTLLASLKDLDSRGVFTLVVADDPEAAAEIDSEGLAHLRIVGPATDAEASHELVKGVRAVIDGDGLHFEKIAVAAALSPALRTTLEDIFKGKLRLLVFATDFQVDYIQDRQDSPLRILPIVSSDGSNLLQGPSALTRLLSVLVLAPRINVRETAHLVVNGNAPDGILDRLVEIRDRAEQNLDARQSYLADAYPHLADCDIFDDRSGAVSFLPWEWRDLGRGIEGPLKEVYEYFCDRLPGYWQPGRPCFRRILYTPSRVLLRGEEYYSHMRNISPVDRIRAMLKELNALNMAAPSLISSLQRVQPSSRAAWKLCLAFLDQLRNVALQLFSFAHAADVMLWEARDIPGMDLDLTDKTRELVKALYGDDESRLHSFVGKSIAAYYSCLFGEQEGASSYFQRALGVMVDDRLDLKQICANLEKWFAQRHLEVGSVRVGNLVRRWREADHPGENLLVTELALEEAKSTEGVSSVAVVGVGWGGIEFPFLFRYLSKARGLDAEKQGRLATYVANWSHYRDDRDEIVWVPFPRYRESQRPSAADLAIIMDDNTLSGITLERVREQLLLTGAEKVRFYVTRFSGERRWHHMQMANHGVIDPEFMLSEVRGYIGETPFARSWSTREGDYKSQIGVFSLARRRILECIHNNSTVEAWDREGF